MREPDAADFEEKLKNKSLRAIHAILRTGYDALTKMVLVVYAMDLNVKRKDWAVWRSLKTLSAYSSVGRDTIIEIQRRLEEDKVLHAWTKRHHLQKKNKAGRYSKTYSLVVARLEALAKKFTVDEVRPSRGRRRSEIRRVQGLKSKAWDKRRQAEETKEYRAAHGLDEQHAYQVHKTGRIIEKNETAQWAARKAEDEARQAEADLKGDLEGARFRLELLTREVEECRRRKVAEEAKPRDREDDPQDLAFHSARTMYNDALQAVRAHIKLLNKMEREAKEQSA